MKIGRFTQFAFVLAIVALIVGFSACDQVQQVLFPPQPEKPPEMPPAMVRDSDRRCCSANRTIRCRVWFTNARWL